jgi:hypothetical protein
MSDEKRALTRHSAPPSEADYEAILAAVMETGRGRWFLHEFAQRNRHTETRGVLSAIQKIEGMLRAQGGDIPGAGTHPAAAQIATAIARAREIVAASTACEERQAFDNVVRSLETAQVRMRAVHTRLHDAAALLREEGGHSRICNDLDRQVRDLDAGCAQIEDAAGDIRILVALLNEIESLAEETAPASSGTAPASDSKPMPEALVVTPVAVPPQPQNDPVETGLMVSDTVTLDELDACEAEFESSEADIAAANEPAETAIETVVAVAATADLPAHNTIEPDALIQSDPAEFLLEPLPETDASQSLAPETDGPPFAAEVQLQIIEKKPAPLRLDSFDPLAPLRALSDEEKIALFS